MTEDYYDLLGVSRDADRAEIEQAYREQVSQHHPDVSDDPEAEETFKRLQRAKEVLTDEKQRRTYDRVGHEQFVARERSSETGTAGAGPNRTGFRADPFEWLGRNPTGGFGGFGSLFERFFDSRGGGTTTHTTSTHHDHARKGADLTTSLEIDLEEAYYGVEKQVTLTRPEACPDCDGRGSPANDKRGTCPKCKGRGYFIHIFDTGRGRSKRREPCERCGGEGEVHTEVCSRCDGDGLIDREATLTVEIPPGIESGQTVRLRGEGEPGTRGGSHGDLLVDVTVTDHPDFDRDAADLYHQQSLSFPQAVFGDTIEIPVFDDQVELGVPPGTESGETFQFEGKGMPQTQQSERGTLYIQVQIVTPYELTEEQRRALQDFAKAGDPVEGSREEITKPNGN